jgi:hypothetical protein
MSTRVSAGFFLVMTKHRVIPAARAHTCYQRRLWRQRAVRVQAMPHGKCPLPLRSPAMFNKACSINVDAEDLPERKGMTSRPQLGYNAINRPKPKQQEYIQLQLHTRFAHPLPEHLPPCQGRATLEPRGHPPSNSNRLICRQCVAQPLQTPPMD